MKATLRFLSFLFCFGVPLGTQAQQYCAYDDSSSFCVNQRRSEADEAARAEREDRARRVAAAKEKINRLMQELIRMPCVDCPQGKAILDQLNKISDDEWSDRHRRCVKWQLTRGFLGSIVGDVGRLAEALNPDNVCTEYGYLGFAVSQGTNVPAIGIGDDLSTARSIASERCSRRAGGASCRATDEWMKYGCAAAARSPRGAIGFGSSFYPSEGADQTFQAGVLAMKRCRAQGKGDCKVIEVHCIGSDGPQSFSEDNVGPARRPAPVREANRLEQKPSPNPLAPSPRAYVDVTRDFVPPLPDPSTLGPGRSHFIALEVSERSRLAQVKLRRTAINRINFQIFAGVYLGLDRYSADEQRRIDEDMAALGNGVDLLTCDYRLNATSVIPVLYWLGKVPSAADPQHLSSRVARHPLLFVQGAVSNCPARLSAELEHTVQSFLAERARR